MYSKEDLQINSAISIGS